MNLSPLEPHATHDLGANPLYSGNRKCRRCGLVTTRVEIEAECKGRAMDRDDARQNPKVAADEVRRLLDGRTKPFWTVTSGPGVRPYIKIECDDLRLAHALDDFLIACVKSHGL